MVSLKLVNQITLMIFKNGKLRLMGKGLRDTVQANDIISILFPFASYIETPYLQTQTALVNLNPLQDINLARFSHSYSYACLYEPELFPAISVTLWPDVFVNLFHTGRVTVLGKATFTKSHLLSEIYETLMDMIGQL